MMDPEVAACRVALAPAVNSRPLQISQVRETLPCHSPVCDTQVSPPCSPRRELNEHFAREGFSTRFAIAAAAIPVDQDKCTGLPMGFTYDSKGFRFDPLTSMGAAVQEMRCVTKYLAGPLVRKLDV